ncbi:CRTAC1 family protein [Exilibacterium tricleocarpae]|uniref:CRTAC1 family protein n=1 Tax=Exilibacterium tricleocarpae TaxID=2591008 RepID=A0A545SQV2_9GAMM|nr:CRTAC1 family protein [Exilibacterium tricleocarpae]TQV67342.1 CRTAC1 family protein [Exilibacterium tricleocarpae]
MKNLAYLCLGATLVSACGDGSGGGDNPDISSPGASAGIGFRFNDATTSAGLDASHGFAGPGASMPMLFSSGIAVSDYDNDGDLDIYFVSGSAGANRLFQNQGDTTFVDIGDAAGVAIAGEKGSGPAFADIDGDGFVDLFVGAIDGDPAHLFQNNRDGTFTEVTAASGLGFSASNQVSAAFGDIDNDGLLDLFVTHWGNDVGDADSSTHLWRNLSATQPFQFTDLSDSSGLSAIYRAELVDYSFTPNFTDMDSDGDQDILLASDFGTSKVLRNDGGTTFVDITTAQISDKNGMGAAVGDYDNDGDLDWFVSAISYIEPPAGAFGVARSSGNRLYNNDGAGNFTDVTGTAGVLRGDWGWGSCFADFNNDGHLDIFHVNGWVQTSWPQYERTRSKLFLARGDGTFASVGGEAGISDMDQGRGLVCADMDADGDIDILVANNRQRLRFYDNQLNLDNHFINIRLDGTAPNTEGVGARISVEAAGRVQTREMRRSNNYTSQNPARVHFGLGAATQVDTVTVQWPDGGSTRLDNIEADQHLVIAR